MHAGTKHCSESEIKKQVKVIKEDKYALWVGMGDYAECIVPSDPRWDIEVISDWIERANVVESQRRWLVDLFKPIADKCIGLLEGNHETTIRLRNYQDIHLDLCRDLGVTPLGYSCFVRLIFNHVTPRQHATVVTAVFQHGSGAAQTEGGKIMRLKKFMDSFDADIYGMGHLHDIKTNSIAMMTLNEGLKIRQKVRVGAVTGSWLRTYSQGIRAGYSERAGFYPTVLGSPYFEIQPDKKLLRVIG